MSSTPSNIINPAATTVPGHGKPLYNSEALQQLLTGPKLMAVPLQRIALPQYHDELAATAAAAADHEASSTAAPAAAKLVPVAKLPKVVREYPMPGARETHEMAVVGDNLLVVTQQSNSTLVKVQLDARTGRPAACARYAVGDFWDGLHGLFASLIHSGQVWASLQFKSLLIRINPGADLATAPTVEQVIELPSSVYGPHCVCECGEDLWTSCKDSSHVVRINPKDPKNDFSVYPCSGRPIFIAMHPTSHDMYASLDLSSKIWRLDHCTKATHEIDIPSSHGRIPVGLVAGPDNNVWFTLLGDASGGTGTFARIFATGALQFFSLTTSRVGAKAGLIHLAFDWDIHEYRQKRKLKQQQHTGHHSTSSVHHLWLLSSSLIASSDGYGIDAVFGVVLDSKLGGGRILSQHSITLPTQRCANHRLLPHRTGLFVSQLSMSSLAHVTGAAAFHPADMACGEATDMYNNFGQGQPSSQYVFTKCRESRATLLVNAAVGGPPEFMTPPQPPAVAGQEVLDLKRSSGRSTGGKRSRTASGSDNMEL